MGETEEMNRAKRQRMNRHVGFVRMESKRPRAKKSFTWLYWSMPCVQGMRSCSKCWLEHWGKRVKVISEQRINYSKIGGHVLTRVKKGDIVKERLPIWKKPKHAQDQDRPTESQPMGQKNIPWRCWSARFGDRPMRSCRWIRKVKGSPSFMKILMIRL
jgi:hypothetical protein